jgi:hypothetical protein
LKKDLHLLLVLILWWIVEGISYAFVGGGIYIILIKQTNIPVLPLHSMSNLIVEPFLN